MSGGARPRRLGDKAEDLAEAHFARRGFLTLARNHRTLEGEIDLVVGRGDLVVFAEVKLRRPHARVNGLESVTATKQRRIVLAALRFVQEHRLEDRALRFDVVAVTSGQHPKIEHIEGAFEASDALPEV